MTDDMSHVTEIALDDHPKSNGHVAEQNGKAPPEAAAEKKEEELEAKISPFAVLRFADAQDYIFMAVGLLCGCAQGVGVPINFLFYGKMIDKFINHQTIKNVMNMTDAASPPGATSAAITTASEPAPALPNIENEITLFVQIYAIIGGIVFFLAILAVSLWYRCADRQLYKIRVAFFNAVLRQEMGWWDTKSAGEINTLATQIDLIRDGLNEKVPQFIQSIAQLIAAFAVAFSTDWKLTLVMLSVAPLLVICGGTLVRMTQMAQEKEAQAYSKAGGIAKEALTAIKTVTAFNGQAKTFDRYASYLSFIDTLAKKTTVVRALVAGTLNLLLFGSFALAFWYGSKLVREGDGINGGGVMLVFLCVLIGTFGLSNVSPNLEGFARARGAATKIFAIIDRKSEIDPLSEEGLKPTAALKGHIEFRDVKFAYPTRDNVPVLQGVNFKLEPCKSYAFVGASGSGKSTIIGLLSRFYNPTGGQITLDGTPINDLNTKWLRDRITVVNQEPSLLDLTVEENLKLAKSDATREQIEAACKAACAHEFIMRLPEQYNTRVGERGGQLSGGQKQRIAIARALLRSPKILLLDEATSALDNETEAAIQQELDRTRSERTTLIVAHRLSTVRSANCIYVMDKGVILEQGTHDELMNRKGPYFNLVQSQQGGEDDDVDEDVEKETGETVVAYKRMGSRRSLRRQNTAKEEEPEEKKEEVEFKIPSDTTKRLLLLNKPEWGFLGGGVLCAFLTGAGQPAFTIFFTEILGLFAEPDPVKKERLQNLYSLAIFGVAIGVFLLTFGQFSLLGVAGVRLIDRIRRRLFGHVLYQEISWFELPENSSGIISSLLASECTTVSSAAGHRLGLMLNAFSTIVTSLVIAFIYGWKLALLVLAYVPFIMVAGVIQGRVLSNQARGNKEEQARVAKLMTEALDNMRTVAALTLEPFVLERYRKNLADGLRRARVPALLAGVTWSFSQCMIFFLLSGTFKLGSYLVQIGDMTFDHVFRVYGAITFGAMSIGQQAGTLPDYNKGIAAAAKVFSILDRKSLIDARNTEGLTDGAKSGEIRFDQAEFTYVSRPDQKVLQGLNLRIEPQQTVALVGESGSGKSTVVSMIERFYDCSAGKRTLDGNDLTAYNVKYMRSRVSIVSQEPILFDVSIADNIAFGDNSRTVPMDEIIAAAKKANIHEFVQSLPERYETRCGASGQQLSGGQKQRICIARALVSNPVVLLLDEATSALDSESEKVVQAALEEAQQGRTCIVIAHRLSTVKNAHKICVVEKGKVIEEGTHAQLMDMKGKYYTLYMISSTGHT